MHIVCLGACSAEKVAFLELFSSFNASTSLEAEASDTEAENCNCFSRANSIFGKKAAKTQPAGEESSPES